MYEVGDQGLKSDWVSQNWEDIQEVDALYDRLELQVRTKWGGNDGRTFLGKSVWAPRRLLRYSTSDIMVDVSGYVAAGKKSTQHSDIASAIGY